MKLPRLEWKPNRRRRAVGWLVLALCIAMGCSDYGIKEGDSPQIIALKKMGAKVQYGIDGSYQIDLNDTSISDEEMYHFEEIPTVQSLNLSDTYVTDEGLKHLVEGPENLSILVLDNTDITDRALENLQGLSRLSSLSLCGTSITDQGLAHMPERFPRLSSLRLMNCTEITNDGLKSVAQLPRLETLHLAECPQMTDEGLEHFIGKKTLRMVHLVNTGCTNAAANKLFNSLGGAIIVRADGKAAGFTP